MGGHQVGFTILLELDDCRGFQAVFWRRVYPEELLLTWLSDTYCREVLFYAYRSRVRNVEPEVGRVEWVIWVDCRSVVQNASGRHWLRRARVDSHMFHVRH